MGGADGPADRRPLLGRDRNVVLDRRGRYGIGGLAGRHGLSIREEIPGARSTTRPDEAALGHERGEPALQRPPGDSEIECAPHGIYRSTIRKYGHDIDYGFELGSGDLFWHVRATRFSGAITWIVPYFASFWRDISSIQPAPHR